MDAIYTTALETGNGRHGGLSKVDPLFYSEEERKQENLGLSSRERKSELTLAKKEHFERLSLCADTWESVRGKQGKIRVGVRA